ncbi:MAG TPA: excinuclease ABC subunit UvrC, partial [Actinomycetes bacterium]|nr:excinuclease ABC subunit UvrC [Actinomycetes bacterium]
AWAIRETLDLLLRVFPARTCSAGVFKRARQVGRPCLLGYIGKCSAPCVGRVDADEHRRIVEDFCDFMSGQTATYVRRLGKEMQAAADSLEYERAARLRDDIAALHRALERNAVVLGDGTDADVIGCAEDPLEAAFQVFHVRGGRVRGQRGFVVDKVEETSTGDLVEHFLQQFYGEESGEAVPREVLVPAVPTATDALTEWLSGRRGSRVRMRVPRRGDKRALLETVSRNAGEALALHKTRRAADLTTRSVALQEIQDALGLESAPLRIECFDVSNLQGTDVVASMVVFEDGLARKSEYRRFAIRGPDGQNDVAAIHEVISRRFRRYLEEQEAIGALADVGTGAGDALAEGDALSHADAPPESGGPPKSEPGAGSGEITDARGRPVEPRDGRPRKFAYPPNLVVVDGGAPQVAAAQRALDELGIEDVALCGLAKRLEEVWLPGESEPIILARASEGLYLLQRVRDEAHRFAIAFHRQKRSRSMTTSVLDGVPGLGDVRRKALLARFGSLRKLKAASVEQIAQVPGIGRRTAEAIAAVLAAGPAPVPAVNTATGELLDEPAG